MHERLDRQKRPGVLSVVALLQPSRRTYRTGIAGFTLVELLVALSMLGILLAIGLPQFTSWSRNTKTRGTAEALQTGLRLAQAEAVRRNRQVMLSLTTFPVSLTAKAEINGGNWVVRTVPVPGETAQFIEGASSTGGLGVNITVSSGSESICFNSFGRLVDNQSPGGTAIDAGTCDLPTSTSNPPYTAAYDFAAPASADTTLQNNDRKYRVTVALGGQIRMCDLNRSIGTSPDGC